MPDTRRTDLAALFQAALDCLLEQRQSLNQMDTINGNHGDHMVEIFQTAIAAARQHGESDLSEAMENASLALRGLADNGSARLYAIGLEQFARQFRLHGISLDDLLSYGQNLLREESETEQAASGGSAPSGTVLKALASGLTSWSQSEQAGKAHSLNLGALFELGMAYLQARQRGGSKAEILADAAASASPLGALPHRYQSGKLAIQSLLQAMRPAD
jgi:hypothetical protein